MKASEILNKFKLKRTSCREGIIDIILNAKYALSENEIKEKLTGNYDRTTFYRSFKTLVEKGIIHKIVIDNLLVKYSIDNSLTNKDDHAHFFCNYCKKVKCMDSIPMPNYKLPEEYQQNTVEVLIKGICKACQKEK